MPDLLEMLQLRWEHLVGRLSGPLNFRLFVMPTVVTFFAVRAALRDARAGQPGFFRRIIAEPAMRGPLIRSALRDIGKIIVVAIVLDATYQIMVLKTFYIGEELLVVLCSVIVPYILFRGPIAGLIYRLQKRKKAAAAEEARRKV